MREGKNSILVYEDATEEPEGIPNRRTEGKITTGNAAILVHCRDYFLRTSKIHPYIRPSNGGRGGDLRPATELETVYLKEAGRNQTKSRISLTRKVNNLELD